MRLLLLNIALATSLFSISVFASVGEEDNQPELCSDDVVEKFKASLVAPIEEHLPEVKRQLRELHAVALQIDAIDFRTGVQKVSDLVNAHGWKPQTSDNNLTDHLTAIRDGAHDVKNALGICLLQTEQLLLTSNDEESRVIREAIASNLQLSIDILEEALNPDAIQPRKVSLTEIFKRIENSLLALPSQFEVSFIAPPTGYSLKVSPVSIQRIVQNLVFNSIEAFQRMPKMPNPARIQFSIKIVKQAQHGEVGEQAVFIVEDNGPGMDVDRVAGTEIIRPNLNGKNHRGIGTQSIGLMLDLNGGTLDVHSEPGKGTKVTLFFRVIAPNPALAAVKVEPNSVLFVEDNKDMLDLLLMLAKMSKLPSAGVRTSKMLWDVVEAHHGHIRCVVLDQSLGDGISLETNVSRIRALGYSGPILMVSGDGHIGDKAPDGVAERMIKPVLFPVLEAAIERHAPLPKK